MKLTRARRTALRNAFGFVGVVLGVFFLVASGGQQSSPVVATTPVQWSEQFGVGEVFPACASSALPVNPIVCVANVGQTCYLTNSCGQKSDPGVIECDGTCGNKYETSAFTPSGHYLGTYDFFREGPVYVCSFAGKPAATGNFACAPNLNIPGYCTGSGDSTSCTTTTYYAESNHGGWGVFALGQNWCEETGVEWVECGPAIAAPPDSNCSVTPPTSCPAGQTLVNGVCTASPPSNGAACGSANGVPTASAPTSGLCSTGQPSIVSETCYGYDGSDEYWGNCSSFETISERKYQWTCGSTSCEAPYSATPTVTSCTEPSPSQKWGGMTYVNWAFGISDIHSLEFKVKIDNDPGKTSDLFLQLYDANIDGSGQYFGLQTTGMVLFSRFGTANPSDASVPSGSTLALDGNPNNGEGSTYISVRKNFGSLPAGTYTVRMTRDTYDGVGDWFKYYVTFPGASEQYIGAIRFPRSNASTPASFRDGGGTWTEFWDNNGPTLNTVPFWHVRTSVTANGCTIPVSATSNYSPMPNSDIYAETDGGFVSHVLGACTARTHPAGLLWSNVASPDCTVCTPPQTLVNGVCTNPAPGAVSAVINATSPVSYGSRSTLTWSSANAVSCTAIGPWSNLNPASGTQFSGSGLTDPLVTDTTFTFECTGADGSTATDSATVVVQAPSCSNGANNPQACDQCPDGLAYVNGACTACLNGGCTSGMGGGGTPTNPTGSLVCNNSANNPYECSVFTPAAALSATPSVIDVGQSTTLTWSSTHATSCTGSGFSTRGATAGSASSGPLTTPGTESFQISCAGPGGSAPAAASVRVLDPSASMTANPARVPLGSTTQISWSANGVRSCTVTGPSGTLASGPADESFSFTTGSPQSAVIQGQSVFTITCETHGAPITRSIIANVNPKYQEF